MFCTRVSPSLIYSYTRRTLGISRAFQHRKGGANFLYSHAHGSTAVDSSASMSQETLSSAFFSSFSFSDSFRQNRRSSRQPLRYAGYVKKSYVCALSVNGSFLGPVGRRAWKNFACRDGSSNTARRERTRPRRPLCAM